MAPLPLPLVVPRHTTRLKVLHFIKSELAELQGYSNSSRKGEAVCWSPGPRVGEGVSCQQLRRLSAPGRCSSRERGGHREGEAPEAPTLPASSPTPVLSSTAWLPSGPEAEQKPRSSGGRWMGTEHQGKGPSAQGRREMALPRQLPTEFTAQKTPLVHQLHVEVY